MKENFPHAKHTDFYAQALNLIPKRVSQNNNRAHLSACPTNKSISLQWKEGGINLFAPEFYI
jgi:hypothetical protein